ncbi:XRE family transcriptional regulator [Gordonia sp. L191]|uniref:XRE family transcriptional regulator n=1 Tax=Gordonia sp. L191 TaxID=2982699 RepID=UPI0024BF2286|nr:XRE family transcriptional regulator [Gordonia sp. L191]WHU47738.1 XRE family transcriptional regulator [Gordonia sp. L191]
MAHTDQFDETFADKLDFLFRTVRQPDGKRLTQSTIVKKAHKLAGVKITEGYLSHLRTGRVKSPSFHVVQGIAAAFDVDISFFAPNKPTVSAGDVLHDAGIEHTAFRLAGLPQEDIDVINDMITIFRARRNLPATTTKATDADSS